MTRATARASIHAPETQEYLIHTAPQAPATHAPCIHQCYLLRLKETWNLPLEQSCTFHDSSCNGRNTYCTLRFVGRYSDLACQIEQQTNDGRRTSDIGRYARLHIRSERCSTTELMHRALQHQKEKIEHAVGCAAPPYTRWRIF